MRLKITIKFESSSHDGYCSGEECDYESETITKIVDEENIDFDHTNIVEEDGRYFMNCCLLPNIDKFFQKEINDINHGSGYCELSFESTQHNLGTHDYRITPLRIEICDTQFIYSKLEAMVLKNIKS